MGRIVKREGENGTTYMVKVRIKVNPPQTATSKSKADAKLWKQQTEAAMSNGRCW